MIETAIAKALYEDWQKSDKELSTPWEEAPGHLQRVFLRKAEVAYRVIDSFRPTA